MTASADAKKKDLLDAKRDALIIAANIIDTADGDNIVGKAVDTALSAAAMVLATAIAGSPEALQRQALDAAVDYFVTAAKKLSLNIDGEKGLLHGMAAAQALDKLMREAGDK